MVMALQDILPLSQEDNSKKGTGRIRPRCPREARALGVESVDRMIRTGTIHMILFGSPHQPPGRGGRPGLTIILLPLKVRSWARSGLRQAISGAWPFPTPRAGDKEGLQARQAPREIDYQVLEEELRERRSTATKRSG